MPAIPTPAFQNLGMGLKKVIVIVIFFKMYPGARYAAEKRIADCSAPG
jgi:hypothetical protein